MVDEFFLFELFLGTKAVDQDLDYILTIEMPHQIRAKEEPTKEELDASRCPRI